jgi:hypothetical protein
MMTTPFGPQLIGETEKTLGAILLRSLDGTGLTEPDWVTIRLADQLDGTRDTDGLAAAVADRAHLPDATTIVANLTADGVLEDGQLTPAGRGLLATVQARIAETASPIWRDLPADDVAATTRLLNEVIARGRAALG